MLKYTLALVGLSLLTLSAQAAVLVVDGTGKLTGATGVDVNGSLYDVSLGDGSCVSLFSGCDSADDFAFTTISDATDAAQALLDQVFVGVFDTNSALTQGGGDNQQLRAYVAYGFDNGAGGIEVLQASNFSTGWGTDNVGALHFSSVPDVNNALLSTWRTYAVFTPSAVPVPAAAWLFGSALIGLVGVKRKK